MTELIKHGKQLRSWQKSTPGSPQHPYTRTDAKGALKENGNYSAKQMPIWHLETLLLNVITLFSDLQRECAA
ncbi:hypothetical protein T09_14084 [Trichinella sp. T9]|nr:hypothetical protein T09_14084 [Trichinella sp. T9]